MHQAVPPHDSQDVDVLPQQDDACDPTGDSLLFNKLAAENFNGEQYAQLQYDQVRVGLKIIDKWVATGEILAKCKKLGFPIAGGEAIVGYYNKNIEERKSLTNLTVARAVHKFKENALIKGGWKPSGKAAMMTYFLNKAALECKDVMLSATEREKRRYEEMKLPPTQNKAPLKSGQYEEMPANGPSKKMSFVDQHEEMSIDDHIDEIAPNLSSTDKKVLFLRSLEYPHKSINEILNLKERASERSMRRARHSADRRNQ